MFNANQDILQKLQFTRQSSKPEHLNKTYQRLETKVGPLTDEKFYQNYLLSVWQNLQQILHQLHLHA